MCAVLVDDSGVVLAGEFGFLGDFEVAFGAAVVPNDGAVGVRDFEDGVGVA